MLATVTREFPNYRSWWYPAWRHERRHSSACSVPGTMSPNPSRTWRSWSTPSITPWSAPDYGGKIASTASIWKGVNEQLRQTVRQLQEDEAAARRIQFQLLPENDKIYRHYCFSCHLLTSQYLSGDFVDYFVIDGDHLGFYIADVSGHGVSSAFVTVMLKSYIGRYRELHRQNRDRGFSTRRKR